jgi:outer membrane lipoprotein-sorting protein
MLNNIRFAWAGLASVACVAAASAQGLQVSRANLANSASFVVTQATSPKGGSKFSQTARVEVKGNKARIETSNPQIGSVVYLANEKGFYLYIPANKVAQKQGFRGDVNSLLRVAFGRANEQLKAAKKVGTATVSGLPTDVYKDAATGTVLYVARKPGFRLPVKTVITNEGGTQTVTVSKIRTNLPLADARFAVPAGVRVMESTGAAGGMSLPGVGR